MLKGQKMSLESRLKISKFQKGKKPNWKSIEAMRKANIGHHRGGWKLSEDTKKRISIGMKGIKNRLGTIGNREDKAWRWKGENAVEHLPKYKSIHQWVKYHYGKAKECWFDKSHKSNRYEWANVSKSYLRDINDWTSLCPNCHHWYDRILGGENLYVK
jgi:hypothetical protein